MLYQPRDENGEPIEKFEDDKITDEAILINRSPVAGFLNLLNDELGKFLIDDPKAADSRLLTAFIRLVDERIAEHKFSPEKLEEPT